VTLLCDSGSTESQALWAAPQRGEIAAAWRRSDADCMGPLIEAATLPAELRQPIDRLARQLVAGLRRRQSPFDIAAMLREFPLSSVEGMALMAMAESVLRIPDDAGIDRLIADKLAQLNWARHFRGDGTTASKVVAVCLSLLSRLAIADAPSATTLEAGRWPGARRGVVRTGVRAAIRLLGRRFVIAADIGQALRRSVGAERRGYRHSFDMLGEAALGEVEAHAYREAYRNAVEAVGAANAGRGVIAGAGVSVKLSALHPRYEFAQRGRVLTQLLPRLRELAEGAGHHDIGLCIDAEESERLDLSLDLIEALLRQGAPAGWQGLGLAVQAYQKRALPVVDYLIELARASGHRLSVRLVKGAYWDGEVKRAQVDGMRDYPVFTRRAQTEASYLACARKLLAHRDLVYPQFASHNARTVASVYQMAGGADGDGYEFQCLYGMGETLYDQIVAADGLHRACRIYAPVGKQRELLPYLIRRLLENGAAQSFLGLSADQRASIEEVVADPLDALRCDAEVGHSSIPLPSALYGNARRNSPGIDLADAGEIARLRAAIAACRAHPPTAVPLLEAAAAGMPAREVRNPADGEDLLGWTVDAAPADIDHAVAAAVTAAPAWAATPVAERAAILERAADLMAAEAPVLIALCVREAGKTLAASVAELREAIDYCRYYAAEMRAIGDGGLPLGVVACISPWNFPLAIFTGQVGAALAAGNVVLAKPAEQSPLTAHAAALILHRAGVPRGALQLLTGDGAVGSRLIADRRIDGVLFTGSNVVAREIQRVLAARGNTDLVAETGGVNCMIVDSTALPEQAVADIIRSAFDCAGQRCSSLRVLCLQEEIAEHVLDLLRGAMAELHVGDPADIACDVGPVIEAAAAEAIRAHVDELSRECRVFRAALSDDLRIGNYVAPTLIEIDSLQRLHGEVFGPVLHVLRYRSSQLGQLLAEINSMGYGLTLGIQSRVEATERFIVERARVGNIYVNRNMIGAVVGVQPFGGEGLSGTGPKAGGPLYLHRLMQRTAGPGWVGGGDSDDAAEAEFRALREWLAGISASALDANEREQVLRWWQQYADGRPPAGDIRLPGPAGEDNRLLFVPRGLLFGEPASFAGALNQVGAAVATGNRLLLPDEPRWRDLLHTLPPAVSHRVGVGRRDDTSIAAWLVDGEMADSVAMVARNRELAGRPGAILPMIVGGPGYDLWRLVVERTVSVNTAAIGGVVELLDSGG
jgi:RHH-type proline utilization regulon transcriptional repressor/proline dehydrogenase/delta 1-pyrroline-5-carboxylate dehydrogenase